MLSKKFKCSGRFSGKKSVFVNFSTESENFFLSLLGFRYKTGTIGSNYHGLYIAPSLSFVYLIDPVLIPWKNIENIDTNISPPDIWFRTSIKIKDFDRRLFLYIPPDGIGIIENYKMGR